MRNHGPKLGRVWHGHVQGDPAHRLPTRGRPSASICVVAVCLALLIHGMAQAADEGERTVWSGDYRIGITRISRTRELVGADTKACLVITVYVEAIDPQALERATELAQDARAWAGPGGKELILKQVRELPKQDSKSRRWVEVSFVPPAREVSQLARFSAAVSRFTDKTSTVAEFTQLGPKGQEVRRDGVKVRLESAGWEEGAGAQPRFLVEVVASFPPTAPERGRTAWLGDQVELVDRDGTAWGPEQRAWSCRRDARGEILETRVLTHFSPLALRRGVGAIRYRAERVTGIRSSPYRFERIALP